eukprot:PLAT3878.3.p2 GENE.PLAT3878.3~~PLAT3878.3.p2  ORF type:complete len:137 (-),score=24.36 PLAT3878.3:74-484(-)
MEGVRLPDEDAADEGRECGAAAKASLQEDGRKLPADRSGDGGRLLRAPIVLGGADGSIAGDVGLDAAGDGAEAAAAAARALRLICFSFRLSDLTALTSKVSSVRRKSFSLRRVPMAMMVSSCTDSLLRGRGVAVAA